MLDEQEFAAWLEDPGDLLKSALLVHDTTEHQRADHEIYALVSGWQRLSDAVAELNLEAQSVSLFDQVRFHEWVGVHSDPCDACGWEVMKVGAGTGADLQNCAREVREQVRFVVPQILIGFHAASSHEPGEDLEAERSRTTAKLIGIQVGHMRRQDQHSDYSE